MKNKYNILIMILALGLLYMYDSNNSQTVTEHKKPVFFDRLPAGMKKARQVINIDIDYEKLPGRKDIRLIGRVNVAHLPTDILDYKWTLAKNVVLKNGDLKGKINLRVSNEVTLDVSIKDMNQKIDVKLEASAHGHAVKLGSIKTFTFDPQHEEEQESARLEKVEMNKVQSENLPKEEFLKQQMQITRKVSAQQ